MDNAKLTARLVVSGADRAIEFYQKAFGAELLSRYTGQDGSVVHAEIRIGANVLTLKDEDDVDRSAATLGGSPVIFMLEVDDADAVAEAMREAGATVIFPVSDSTYGYRDGRLADPAGIPWMVSQRIEDLTTSEVQARVDGS